MDSFYETHEETTSEIEPRLLAHFNSYRFFVFLDRDKHQPLHSYCNLQKLSFKLKEERTSHEKYLDCKKQILMSFHDLADELETQQALMEIKAQGQQYKTRLIVYAQESVLIRLLAYARDLDVKPETIPIVLYSHGINNDLATFLGWGASSLGNLFSKSVGELQPECKKWIQSPTEKIDSWTVHILVHQDVGQIYRYNKQRDEQYREDGKEIKQGFFSSVSIGTHPKLVMDFEQGRQNQSGVFDKFFYKLQGLKKFCCVGTPNMKAATGVVNAQFTDETGEDHEIFRQFHEASEPNSGQESHRSMPYLRKRILSIVISNIDRFHGQKLRNNKGFKMNDNKLELMTFESLTDYTKVASIAGDIKLSLESQQSVFVQVNDNCFRLVNPTAILIRKAEKYKVLINKETLGC